VADEVWVSRMRKVIESPRESVDNRWCGLKYGNKGGGWGRDKVRLAEQQASASRRRPFRFEPLKDGPGSLKVFTIVSQDVVHNLGALRLVPRFRSFDVFDDSPSATVFVHTPFEAYVLLNDLEAVASSLSEKNSPVVCYNAGGIEPGRKR